MSSSLIKTVLAIEEIGLIEQCLKIVENSIDRGDLEDITSNHEEIMEYYSQGYFDDIYKICNEVEAS